MPAPLRANRTDDTHTQTQTQTQSNRAETEPRVAINTAWLGRHQPRLGIRAICGKAHSKVSCGQVVSRVNLLNHIHTHTRTHPNTQYNMYNTFALDSERDYIDSGDFKGSSGSSCIAICSQWSLEPQEIFMQMNALRGINICRGHRLSYSPDF